MSKIEQSETAQREILLMDFWLEPANGYFPCLPAIHGSLRFENGGDFREAARWRKVGLDEFLYRAIEECLAEAQAAMGKEYESEVKGNEPTDRC